MQDEREKVVELIKTGKYYDEALKWYNSRYIMPKTQLATVAIFGAIAIFLFFVSLITTIGIFPLQHEETFSIDRELKINEGMIVKDIGEKKENASYAYLKYMLAEYVKSREEYYPNRSERDYKFVIEISSDPVFIDYMTLADKNTNPNHPVWLYGTQAIREIFPSKTDISELMPDLKNYVADKEYIANISFVSSLLFIDNLQTQEKFEATVKFKFEPIAIDQKTAEIKQLPKLTITDYKTKKL